MIKTWAAIFVTVTVSIAGAQNSSGGQNKTPANGQNSSQAQPAQASGQPAAPAHPRRVTAKLDGFDLAPQAASPNQIGGASRSVAGAARLVAYAPHKGRVFTLRPSFWWQGTPGTTYKFHLQDVTGQFEWDREVGSSSLDYPADAPPLEPGKTYIWRVYPDSPILGGTGPQAMIVVLDAPERAQIEAAESGIAGDDLDAGMARAKVFFDHRLWYDAVMAYSALIIKYPGDPKLYLMRGSLYDQLPATQALADQDFSRAE